MFPELADSGIAWNYLLPQVTMPVAPLTRQIQPLSTFQDTSNRISNLVIELVRCEAAAFKYPLHSEQVARPPNQSTNPLSVLVKLKQSSHHQV